MYDYQAQRSDVIILYYILQAVALYDYQAQRSDEISFLRGNLIKVLYKDNENWWMGELEDGAQGFFPANYVADCKFMIYIFFLFVRTLLPNCVL